MLLTGLGIKDVERERERERERGHVYDFVIEVLFLVTIA
jgi:hypothetical protein